MLRKLPEDVDDFFGRAWVEAFCGSHTAAALAGRLPGGDVTQLRSGLRHLYRTAFALQDTGAALRTPTAASGPVAPLEFVSLDITDTGIDAKAEPAPDDARPDPPPKPDPWGLPPPMYSVAAREGVDWQPGRSSGRDDGVLLPPLDAMLGQARVDGALRVDVTRMACDTWLADGNRSVVVGGPGAGKSSLLRHMVSDLLDDTPRSAALATKFGSRLPVWLPFSFLCEHLRENTQHSIESATRAWLTRYSAQHLHDLVARALADNRLLLVVDGLDEWTQEDTARPALALLENYVCSRDVAAVVSTRPYALPRLTMLAGRRVGNLAPLSAAQQKRMAHAAFSSQAAAQQTQPAGHSRDRVDGANLISGTTRHFWEELDAVADLRALAAVPLFLLMLAGMWSSGPLPTRRMEAYRRLVSVLLDEHPAIRRRDVWRPQTGIEVRELRQVLAAAAYRLRSSETGPFARKPGPPSAQRRPEPTHRGGPATASGSLACSTRTTADSTCGPGSLPNLSPKPPTVTPKSGTTASPS
ncbi:NACHT domain-containing protein [Embleya sp. NPDC001921]